jgi:homoserine O-acetyltransferase
MIEYDYYTEEIHGKHEYFELGNFELESGVTLPNARLAYKTFGRLNEAKDNVVLFPHMYSGTSHDMDMRFVGAGRPLDPSKYFIVLPGQFGNGFSSSPTNTPPPFDRGHFPDVMIGDDVRAQHRLLTERFGIDQLQLVLGWSMGAQQTYEWAVRYPDMVLRACPFAGTAKTTPHNWLFVQMHEDAIKSDPAWNGGFYRRSSDVHAGLGRHAEAWSVMGVTQRFYKEEAWRPARYSSLEDFNNRYWRAWFLPMDPNNLLTMAWKWRHSDVSSHTGGDLRAALARIKAKTFVVPFEGDMFFPVADHAYETTMIPDSELRVVFSPWGHFTMFVDRDEDRRAIDNVIGEILATSVNVPAAAGYERTPTSSAVSRGQVLRLEEQRRTRVDGRFGIDTYPRNNAAEPLR